MDEHYSRILSRIWKRSVGTSSGGVSTLENPLPSTSGHGRQNAHTGVAGDTHAITPPTTTVSTTTAASHTAATTTAYHQPMANPGFLQPGIYADASLLGGEQVTAPQQHVPTQQADGNPWGISSSWNNLPWANSYPSYLSQYNTLVSYQYLQWSVSSVVHMHGSLG